MSDPSFSPEENLYDVLGVRQSCSETEIKKAYHSQAKQLHPDKHANKTEEQRHCAQEQFKTVKNAYETLIDSSKRCSYDNLLKRAEIRVKEQLLREQETKLHKERQAELQKAARLKKQEKEQERYVKRLNARRAKAQNVIQTKQEQEADADVYRSFLEAGGVPGMFTSNGVINPVSHSGMQHNHYARDANERLFPDPRTSSSFSSFSPQLRQPQHSSQSTYSTFEPPPAPQHQAHQFTTNSQFRDFTAFSQIYADKLFNDFFRE